MTMLSTNERKEISDLLPWYVAGTLSDVDRQKVDAALGRDATLAEELAIVRDDHFATIANNERLPTPSARAAARLFAQIDAEPVRTSATAQRDSRFDVVGWIASKLDALGPRRLAYAAAVGAIALVVQAGILTTLSLGGGARYETASYSDGAPVSGQSYIMLGFQPKATAAEIADLLQQNRLVIVDGPRAGLFRARALTPPKSASELDAMLSPLRSRADVVRFAAPAAP